MDRPSRSSGARAAGGRPCCGRRAAFAAGNGLTTTDVRALVRLLDQERAAAPAGPTWSAGRSRVTTASVTALLDRLERGGHVRRVPRSDDRRRIEIVVEDSAKELGWAFFGPPIDATAAGLGRRTAAGREVIDAFLDDMLAAADGAGDDGPG